MYRSSIEHECVNEGEKDEVEEEEINLHPLDFE